jgi:hypothetical protein
MPELIISPVTNLKGQSLFVHSHELATKTNSSGNSIPYSHFMANTKYGKITSDSKYLYTVMQVNPVIH